METLTSVHLKADLDYSFLRQAFDIRQGELLLIPESGIPSNETSLVILDCEVWHSGVIRSFVAKRGILGPNQIDLQAPPESEVTVRLRSIGALNLERQIAQFKTDNRPVQEVALSLGNTPDDKVSEKPCAARAVEKTAVNFKIRISPAFVARHCKDEVEKQTSILSFECQVFGGLVIPELLDFFSTELKCGENEVNFTAPANGAAHLLLRTRGATKTCLSLGTLQINKVPKQGCVLTFDGKSNRVDELLRCFIRTPNNVGFLESAPDVHPTTAIEELAGMKDARAVDALVRIIEEKDLDWLVRHEAINGVVEKRERRAIAPLIRIVDNPDEDPEVRWRAASVLACDFKDPLGVKAIRRALKAEDSSRLRYSFIMCLQDGGWWHEKGT